MGGRGSAARRPRSEARSSAARRPRPNAKGAQGTRANLALALAAATLVLGLAACGGGGSSSESASATRRQPRDPGTPALVSDIGRFNDRGSTRTSSPGSSVRRKLGAETPLQSTPSATSPTSPPPFAAMPTSSSPRASSSRTPPRRWRRSSPAPTSRLPTIRLTRTVRRQEGQPLFETSRDYLRLRRGGASSACSPQERRSGWARRRSVPSAA